MCAGGDAWASWRRPTSCSGFLGCNARPAPSITVISATEQGSDKSSWPQPSWFAAHISRVGPRAAARRCRARRAVAAPPPRQVCRRLEEKAPKELGAGASDPAAAGPANGWGESTVRTLIHRLICKGALRLAAARRVVYAPLVSREAWVTPESQAAGPVVRRQLALVDHFTRERAALEDLARLSGW